MAKFSDFIRSPGTAGPPTKEGIRALGFALQSDFPVELEDYLWLGGTQTFTSPEKTQGQANLGVRVGVDVQAYSAALASLGGLTTAADQMVYTTAPNTYATTALSAFMRTLLDDGSAATARATLSLGNVDNTSDANKPISNATQTALNAKAPLASPAFTGNPTAPTPAVGDNDTSLATTAFVRAEFANLLNATGAAPVFACRAWINFDGTGTPAIRGSGNVSSITDNGTGDYTINFTTALPDANYAVTTSGNSAANLTVVNTSAAAPTASALRILTATVGGAATDSPYVSIAIFR